MLTCKDISLEYPTKQVLCNVTLGVNGGDRIGIVGRNGDGKSTLLSVLSGAKEPDAGQVIQSGSATVGVLAQRDTMPEDATVESVLTADVPEYVWASDARKRSIADALAGDLDRTACVGTLSGGQRRRLDLARLLIGDWDILMLDEPTNHLDIRTITWLANHLATRWPRGTGALLVVTHDRWFLDEVCLRMWEVHDGSVSPFEGGFSAYIMQRVERDRLANLAEQKRQNQLRKELAWLSRGAQARRTKPRFHVEAAQALIADVPPLRDTLELQQMAMARLGKQVIDLYDVCVTRGNHAVLRDITWMLGPGERIGIVGDNGGGKTTLLEVLRGALKPTEGHVKIGKTVQLAMLSQQLSELAPIEDDVVRVVLSRYKTAYVIDGKKYTPSALLERLGFSRDQLNARVCDLSGGQRRRLQLLLILLDEPNVLFLDEPGNDLDTDMLAVTEDLLDSWPGTLIVVSHDRTFIERVTDDQFALVGGQLQHLPGGVDDYLALSLRSKMQPDMSNASSSQASAKADDASGKAGLTNAQLHKMRKQAASLERKMQTQQTRVDEAKDDLRAADPYDYEELARIQEQIRQAQEDLKVLEDEWLTLAQTLENDS